MSELHNMTKVELLLRVAEELERSLVDIRQVSDPRARVALHGIAGTVGILGGIVSMMLDEAEEEEKPLV